MENYKAFKLIEDYHKRLQELATKLEVFKKTDNQIEITSNVTLWNEKQKELLEELKGKITTEQFILYELYNHECFYSEEPLEILDTMKEYFEELSEEELSEKIVNTFNGRRKTK